MIALLVRANAERPKQAWTFFLDSDDRHAPMLSDGLDGDRGVATWFDGRAEYRPADGANPDPVDYWMGGHHSQLGPHVEIPAVEALDALREFLTSRIQWVREG